MIQYLYYHTGKEYVSKLSLGRNEEEYSDCEKLFETVRKATEGNTFIYAPLNNNEVLFMQSTRGASGLFAKGLKGDIGSVLNAPAKYIDKFEKSPSLAYNNVDKLPEGTLPQIGRLLEDYSIARDLHHIFAKLVDVLLFGDLNKKIVILAETPVKAMNYIKVLNMLLPLQFMKKVGFAIGTADIPDEDYSIIKNDGTAQSLSIRIWLTDSNSINFNSLSPYYYVFDTKTQRDNVTDEPSITAKLLSEINLCEQSKVNKFAQYVARAFDSSGNFDAEALKRCSALLYFEIKQDAESAKQILNMGCYGDQYQEQAFISAARILLRADNYRLITGQEDEAIISEYRNNNRVAQELSGLLFEYLTATYSSLSPMKMDLYAELIYEDKTGNRLRSYLQRTLIGGFEARVNAFDFTASIFGLALSRNANALSDIKELIRIAADFFGIDNCFRIIPQSQTTKGEAFFDSILKLSSYELRQLMAAVLLASAYKKDTPDVHCEIRLRGLFKILPAIDANQLNQFDFILIVRNKLLELSELIPELDIKNRFNFLFNVKYGKTFITEFLRKLSIDETLTADTLIKSRTINTLYYEDMANAINEKLLDVDYVKKNIKSGDNVFRQYLEYFGSLTAEKARGAAEIDAYLSSLIHEAEVNEEFARYRYEFAIECYNTLSEENKKQVDDNPIKPYEEATDMSEKLRVVESTIKVFGTIKKRKVSGKRPFSGIFLIAFGFSILSMLILFLPALILPASLGTFDAAHILEKFVYYFKPYMLALPVYVFLLELVSYFAFSHGNRVKRANIITVLCGILPILIFVVFYIVFYFIRIDLPFIL
ncbi:MAG: hypothetical protein ACI4MQ_07845 [Candidatus Coproplasma sp.]